MDPEVEERLLPARTWLLTHEQYRSAVRDLLGVEVSIDDLAPELDNGIFRNFSEVGFVGDQLAVDYFEMAKEVVAELSDQRIEMLVPGGTLQSSAAEPFIDALVSRAFRRPASAADRERYAEVFTLAAETDDDPSAPFRAVLRGVLTSPYFLYRTEVGDPTRSDAAVVALTDHEIATLLSFSLLDAPPSAALRDAADRGELSDPETLRTHVAALLADPSADAQLREFLLQWLELDRFDTVEKFEDVFPGFEAVKPAMEAELDAFVDAYGSLESGRLSDLLTAPVPSVSDDLDDFYRSDPSGDENEARVGVLGLGAVLSRHAKPHLTSPTLRGLFVRKRMFCQHIELPPDFTPPPLSEAEMRAEARTTRELYELHASEPACAACHALIDPIGFSLEGFDGAGRLRSRENGYPVETAGDLRGTDVDRTISDALDLQIAMEESDVVAECFATQAFRFYFGQVEPDHDIAPIAEAHAALQREGRIADMVAALLTTSEGLTRTRE